MSADNNDHAHWLIGGDGEPVKAVGALKSFLQLVEVRAKRVGYLPDSLVIPWEYQDASVPVADIIARVDSMF